MHNSAEQLQTGEKHKRVDLDLRSSNNTITWVAETLNGSMRSSFEYQPVGDELYAEDGGAITEVFDDAIIAAEKIAETRPNLLFELRRRIIERGELDDMVGMAGGELPNTMIVVSDFPLELMNSKKDLGGYNSKRKQTMLRVIALLPDGTIKMTSQSLDQSNRKALEAIYHAFGEQPMEGELLGQRIHRDFSPEEQEELIDVLTGIYDASLRNQYDGSWHAGIAQAANRKDGDTYTFAKSQQALINWYEAEKLANPGRQDQLQYMLAATMCARFERWVSVSDQEKYEYAIGSYQSPQRLQAELHAATMQAIASRKTFSGCGSSINMDDSPLMSPRERELKELGFGNQVDGNEEYDFDSEEYCRDCQSPPEAGAEKKMCGPCHLCRECDVKRGGKG